ncbi:ribonuclease H-like domain-containing protein [Lipomyces japonicus]|uniref:ribonuclease H-like domain-containing protein n=1 Tax=Lipomyces japonicus TaxID=56871 RepID=UPI0034CD88C4
MASSSTAELSQLVDSLDIQDSNNDSKNAQKTKNGFNTLRYFLCLDIEATFEQDVPFGSSSHEVIEFGCVLIDGHKQKILDRFHSYVKPAVDQTLHQSCVDYTGVTQDMVDTAPTFAQMISLLDQFMLKHGEVLQPLVGISSLTSSSSSSSSSSSETADGDQVFNRYATVRNFAWVTDGTADIERFLCSKSCLINRVQLPSYMSGPYVDLQRLYRQSFTSRSGCRLADMLNKFGLKFQGRQHCAIDDANAVAMIVLQFIEKFGLHQVKSNRSIYMNKHFRYTSRTIR